MHAREWLQRTSRAARGAAYIFTYTRPLTLAL